MNNRTGTLIDPRNWDEKQAWFRMGMAIAWFDKSIKSWTVYRIDTQGHQVTAAQYYPNAEAMKANEVAINKLSSVDYEIEEWERP